MRKFITVFVALLFAALHHSANAQTTTVGLIQQDTGTTQDGYILFSPLSDSTTYLIDKCGRKVHTWHSSYVTTASVYLLDNGDIIKTGKVFNSTFIAGGSGGAIERIDWNGNVVWRYILSDSIHQLHHDIKPLPNGNVLAILWEKKSAAESLAAGRDPLLLGESVWSEAVYELQPVGFSGANIVWEWHAWDHLIQDYDNTKPHFGIVDNKPQKINLNYTYIDTARDWMHFNSIDYNLTFDQIAIGSPNFAEFYIIDHTTTTAEAATGNGGKYGRGGDILYRWGNAAAYKRADTTEQKLFFQHNVHWIEPGLPYENHIMIFNNGLARLDSTGYTTVDIIRPAVNRSGFYNPTLPYKPDKLTWSYNQGNPNNLYSSFISGAQQLANGNVLICAGATGLIFEINTSQQTVWKYVNPITPTGITQQGDSAIFNLVFRATFFPATYKGFQGRTLVPGATIENENILTDACGLPAISIADAEVAEGNSGTAVINFKVSLSMASADSVGTFYRTKNQTATSPSDYAEQSRRLLFLPGEMQKTIRVTVNGDETPEADETFILQLLRPYNGVFADSIATGTILNDDPGISAAGAVAGNVVANKNYISIYPNPVTDVLNISLPQNKKYSITVADITGRLLQQVTVTGNQKTFVLQTGSLSKGTYILHVVSDTEDISAKFIKN